MPSRSVKHILAASALLFGITSWAQESTWNGRYGGVVAGASIGKTDMTLDPTGTFVTGNANDRADGNFWRGTSALETTSLTTSAFVGEQVRQDRMVYGLEAELGYLRLNDSASRSATVPTSGSPYRVDRQVKTDLFAGLRGRLGYLPEGYADKLMIFGTAGMTVTHAQIDQKFTQLNITYDSIGLSGNKVLLGWTLGAGFEYALSKTMNIRAEYVYANLGKVDNNAVGNPSGFADYSTANKAELTSQIIRVGASWRF